MEKRIVKIIIGKAGGTASKNALTYKISLPTAWINAMQVTPDNRDVLISFDGDKIIIQKE